MIIFGFLGAIALAFGVGQRAQADKHEATTCEHCAKKSDCPHCAKGEECPKCDKGGECPHCKHGKRGGHGHHGKFAHKWEYKCVTGNVTHDKTAAQFNALGEDGYRLAAAQNNRWCFMRPKTD